MKSILFASLLIAPTLLPAAPKTIPLTGRAGGSLSWVARELADKTGAPTYHIEGKLHCRHSVRYEISYEPTDPIEEALYCQVQVGQKKVNELGTLHAGAERVNGDWEVLSAVERALGETAENFAFHGTFVAADDGVTVTVQQH